MARKRKTSRIRTNATTIHRRHITNLDTHHIIARHRRLHRFLAHVRRLKIRAIKSALTRYTRSTLHRGKTTQQRPTVATIKRRIPTGYVLTNPNQTRQKIKSIKCKKATEHRRRKFFKAKSSGKKRKQTNRKHRC